MSTERASRLHYGATPYESPAILPAAVTAGQFDISPHERQIRIRDGATKVMGQIDHVLRNASETPPAAPPKERGHEVLNTHESYARALGASALDTVAAIDNLLQNQ